MYTNVCVLLIIIILQKIPLTFEESEKLRKELRDKRLQRQTEKNNEQ